MLDVTAAILAGGLGTRLRPTVADRPKVLAEISGRPFLTFLFDQLLHAGIRRVVLCTGYLGEQVRAAFGDSYGSLRLFYSQETLPLGTAGALRLALPLLGSESVLVMNGDSYCHMDLPAFWAWHCGRRAAASLALTQLRDTGRYGRVEIDAQGEVLNFDEKGNGTEPGWVNAGVYLIERSSLLTIPAKGVVSLERDVFPTWIGYGLYGYRTKGRFLDIGTPEDYAEAQGFFASQTVRAPVDRSIGS